MAVTIASTRSATVAYQVVAADASVPSAASLQATGTRLDLVGGGVAQSVSLRGLLPSTAYRIDAVLVGDNTVRSISVTTSRNPLKWPFASTSIWNQPIGSAAVYVPAKLPGQPSLGVDPLANYAPMPAADPDLIVLRPDAPATPVVLNTAAWTLNADRCYASALTQRNRTLTTVPMPADWVFPSTRNNFAAAFLMSDRRTLIQAQPLARCVANEPATALVLGRQSEDLYGPGITGAHGGSGLSSLGGTLRVGELLRNQPAPRHALKVDMDTREVVAPCNPISACYRWPAVAADSDATTSYGSIAAGRASPAMKMGALLALPASLNLDAMGLETDAAKKLAWTLQNYGAYLVDSTGGAAYYFATERGPDGDFETAFEASWGFKFAQRLRDNTPWVRDVQRLIVALAVVDNNGPNSVGGGGTPRHPLAVPISP